MAIKSLNAICDLLYPVIVRKSKSNHILIECKVKITT